MQKPMTNLWFRLMSLEYRLKSDSAAVYATLTDAGIESGMTIVDFGCGPGRYSVPAAKLIGDRGTVYAVDVHPLAIHMVERIGVKRQLRNIRTIHSDRDTGLPPSSIDVVLLFDALHDMEDNGAVLRELHRVLKPQGKLSYKDHTFGGEPLLLLMRSNGFSIQNETAMQTTFKKF